MTTGPSEAERLVDALLSPAPAAAVAALELQDPSLRAAAEVARERLAAPSPGALALLRAVSRFPGSRLAELAEHVGAAGGAAGGAVDVRAAARELVDKGLADPARFGRQDCWARTASGAAVLARAQGGASA